MSIPEVLLDGTATDVLAVRVIRSDLRRLVLRARVSGMMGFSSVVVRLAERLEPALRAGELGPQDAARLKLWQRIAQRYLHEPLVVSIATEMVAMLDVGWAFRMSDPEKSHLWNSLIEDRVALVFEDCR